MSRDTAAPAETNPFAEWLWLIIAGAGALLLLIGLILRKKRRVTHSGDIDRPTDFDEQPAAPQPAVKRPIAADTKIEPSAVEADDTPSEPANPHPQPDAVPNPASELDRLAATASTSGSTTRSTASSTAVRPRSRPELEMRFIPESATLGFANLNLRGELKIANIGKAMARNVTLSTTAICAGEQQQAQIERFFSDDPVAQAIDNIRKGDRLTATIEIMIPRSELNSYTYQGREICIPIILAHIAYHGVQEGSDYSTRLSAMIGREANPPGAKLGPLRIDQGPRSFDGLGQRDITP